MLKRPLTRVELRAEDKAEARALSRAANKSSHSASVHSGAPQRRARRAPRLAQPPARLMRPINTARAGKPRRCGSG